jgi:hypothetical protein
MGCSMRDPYKILQIDPDAEIAVIEAAYRGLARRYHPDVNPSPEAAERMKDINWAYEILHDPNKRESFNQAWNEDKKKSTESAQHQEEKKQRADRDKAKQQTKENFDQTNYGIVCQSCGMIGPTKKVSFRYNIGLLFVRFNHHVEGYLCRNCVEDYFWKYTTINWYLGWWGIISFFVTPFYILENLINYVSALNLKRREDTHRVRALGWKLFMGLPILIMGLYFGGSYLVSLKPDITNIKVISFLSTRTDTPTITITPTSLPSSTPVPSETQVPSITPSPTTTPTPAPGDIILFEDFEDSPVCFTVKFLNGEKEIKFPSLNSSSGGRQPLDPHPTSLPYSAIVNKGDTWIQDGKLYIYNGYSTCNLVVDNFSMTLNLVPGSANTGIMIRQNENRYYSFMVENHWAYNSAQFRDVITSVKVFLAYFDGQKNNILGYIPAYKLGIGNISLRITAKGPQIIIYLNSEKVLEIENHELSAGNIGLFAGNGQVGFDDIQVIKQ